MKHIKKLLAASIMGSALFLGACGETSPEVQAEIEANQAGREYEKQFEELNDKWAALWTEYMDLNKEASAMPESIFDPEWIALVETNVEQQTKVMKEIQQLEAPEGNDVQQRGQKILSQSMDYYTKSVQGYLAGAQSGGNLDQVIKDMDSGTKLYEEAKEMIYR